MDDEQSDAPVRLRDDPMMRAAFAAILLHLTLAFHAFAPANADEAMVNLTAFQVLRGEWPIWQYAWSVVTYAGAINGYLNAPLVALFGPTGWVGHVWPLGFRLLEVWFAASTLDRLLGRRAAIVGALATGLWPPRMGFPLLQPFPIASALLCWYGAIHFVARALAAPERGARAGLGLGLCSGLALWSTPQSLPVVLPALAVYIAGTSGAVRFRTRLLALGASFFLASAPWWHYNLRVTWMGTFTENYVAGVPAGLGLLERLAGAMENWSRYAAYVLPSTLQIRPAFAPETLEGSPEASGFALSAVLLGTVTAFLVLLAGRLGGPHRVALEWLRKAIRRRQPSAEDRAGLFWWGCVAGIPALWAAGVGFTLAGSIRHPDVPYLEPRLDRYLLPFFFLVPFMAGFVAASVSRCRRLVAGLTLVPFVLPALLDLASLPDRLELRRRLETRDRQVLELVERHQASFLFGDFWDVVQFQYRTGERALAVALSLHYVVEFPLAPPREPPGLVLLRPGSDLERTFHERWGREALAEVEAPPGLRGYLVPLQDTSGFALWLADAWRVDQEYKRFYRGQADEARLSHFLLTKSAEWLPDLQYGCVLRSRRAGEILAYGPYRRLRPGLYQVEFRFAPPQPRSFLVAADVVTGLTHVAWRQVRELSAEGGTVRGYFELPSGVQNVYETRVSVDQAEGPVTLSEVRLRRVRPESDEARAAARELSVADFQERFAGFYRGEASEIVLNDWLNAPTAKRVATEHGDLGFQSTRLDRPLVYGPYLPLTPGAYEADFVFGGPQPAGAVVKVDVVAELGAKVLWSEVAGLSESGGLLRARFRLSEPAEPSLYETRVFLEAAEGPVTLSKVVLRRVGD